VFYFFATEMRPNGRRCSTAYAWTPQQCCGRSPPISCHEDRFDPCQVECGTSTCSPSTSTRLALSVTRSTLSRLSHPATVRRPGRHRAAGGPSRLPDRCRHPNPPGSAPRPLSGSSIPPAPGNCTAVRSSQRGCQTHDPQSRPRSRRVSRDGPWPLRVPRRRMPTPSRWWQPSRSGGGARPPACSPSITPSMSTEPRGASPPSADQFSASLSRSVKRPGRSKTGHAAWRPHLTSSASGLP